GREQRRYVTCLELGPPGAVLPDRVTLPRLPRMGSTLRAWYCARRTMKILDVNEFYAEQGGGVRTYVHRKLEAAAALGVEVVVVAPGTSDREERRIGGKIVWVKSPKLPPDPRY